ITGKSVTWTRSTRPPAISARFNDRLPCERNGTSDSSLSRATTSTASPRTTVASGQSRGPCSVGDTTVAGGLPTLRPVPAVPAVGALVAAALLMLPAQPTQPTPPPEVSTSILAKSLFDPIQ